MLCITSAFFASRLLECCPNFCTMHFSVPHSKTTLPLSPPHHPPLPPVQIAALRWIGCPNAKSALCTRNLGPCALLLTGSHGCERRSQLERQARKCAERYSALNDSRARTENPRGERELACLTFLSRLNAKRLTHARTHANTGARTTRIVLVLTHTHGTQTTLG